MCYVLDVVFRGKVLNLIESSAWVKVVMKPNCTHNPHIKTISLFANNIKQRLWCIHIYLSMFVIISSSSFTIYTITHQNMGAALGAECNVQEASIAPVI